jgi:hypothetical protein
MAPQIPTVVIMGGRTYHPCKVSNVKRTSYLSSFIVVPSKGNISLHYVSSNNWTFRLESSENGGLVVGVAPIMHNILGQSHVRHLQHGRSHDGMVLFGVHSLSLPRL